MNRSNMEPSSRPPSDARFRAVKRPVGIVPVVPLTDIQLSAFTELIYDRSGIRVSPEQRAILSNRLRRRLRLSGIRSFEAYYDCLLTLHSRHVEWGEIFQAVTGGESYLFRNKQQWDWLVHVYLPRVDREAQRGTRARRLRIWSAACGTGEEPVTIACCLAQGLADFRGWDLSILGTDIAAGAIRRAVCGKFHKRAIQHVDPLCRRHFFTVDRQGTDWETDERLRAMINYQRRNLLEPAPDGRFDLVFLRDVLTYFDERSTEATLDHVHEAMRPGALLICGGREEVQAGASGFGRLRPWLYQKSEVWPDAMNGKRPQPVAFAVAPKRLQQRKEKQSGTSFGTW